MIPFLCLLTLSGPYKSLDSATEHFLYYDVYKEKEALKCGWELISCKPFDAEIEKSRAWNEPELFRFFDAMRRPHTFTNESIALSLDTLSFFENNIKPLAHCTLKGHHITSKQEISSLKDEEIDVAHAVLLALEVPEPKRRSYELMLDIMALEIQKKLPVDATCSQKVQAINTFLFFDMGFRFPPIKQEEKNGAIYTNMPHVLENKRGVCLGVALIYFSIGQRLDLPLSIYTPPGHIFLAYNERNIEPTARGVHVPMSEYLSIDISHVRKRTTKELVALNLMNNAATLLNQEKWSQAEKWYKDALLYAPQDAFLHTLLGITQYIQGENESKDHLLFALKHPYEEALLPNVLAEDILEGTISRKDLGYFFTDYDKTKKGREEKCARLQEVLKRNPRFRSSYLYIGGLQCELLQFDAAINTLKTLTAFDTENVEAEYMLSELSLGRNNEKKALQHLEKVESLLEKKKSSSPIVRDLKLRLLKAR